MKILAVAAWEMAERVEIGAKNDDLATFLEPYIQSGALNFLIGSGASTPAVAVAGNIESELNNLIEAGDSDDADLLCLDFIESISQTHEHPHAGYRRGDDNEGHR